MFYTKTGWNAETDCLKGSGGLVDPQCCGADDGPKAQSSIIFKFLFFFSNFKKKFSKRFLKLKAIGEFFPEILGRFEPFKAIYNTYTKVCCADGTIKTDQSECAAP